MADKTANDDPSDGAEEDATSTRSRKRPIALGVLLVAAIAVYRFVLSPADPAVDATEDQAERIVEEGEILPMEELVVNLTDAGENRYLRVGLALVLEAGVSSSTMEAETPIAVDATIDYLSARSFDELREPGSKSMVRDELSALIREAYGDEKVVRVLFTTFVMQ